MTYRSRYFTALQAAPVLDLLMNDEANPRSLAFQLKDLARHSAALSAMPSGGGWPVLKQRLMEAAAARLLNADVELLCEGERAASGPGWIVCSKTWRRRCPLTPKLLPTPISATRKWSVPRDLPGAPPNHLRLRSNRYRSPIMWSVSPRAIFAGRDASAVSYPFGLCRRITPRPIPTIFGNTVTSFTLPESHTRMSVEASTELEVNAVTFPVFSQSPAWEAVRDTVSDDRSEEGLHAYQFLFDSLRVSAKPELADYARESFPAGRPILEAVLDLTAADLSGFPV